MKYSILLFLIFTFFCSRAQVKWPQYQSPAKDTLTRMAKAEYTEWGKSLRPYMKNDYSEPITSVDLKAVYYDKLNRLSMTIEAQSYIGSFTINKYDYDTTEKRISCYHYFDFISADEAKTNSKYLPFENYRLPSDLLNDKFISKILADTPAELLSDRWFDKENKITKFKKYSDDSLLTTYQYNEDGKLTGKISSSYDGVHTYKYNEFERLAELEYTDNLTDKHYKTTYKYNVQGLLTEVKSDNSIDIYTYENGNLIKLVTKDEGIVTETYDYKYDTLGRLNEEIKWEKLQNSANKIATAFEYYTE